MEIIHSVRRQTSVQCEGLRSFRSRAMRAAPTGAARRLSPAGQLKNASSRYSLGLHIRKRCFGRWAIPHRYGRPVCQPQASFPRYSAPGEPWRRARFLGTAFGHLLPESVERIGSGRELWGLLLAGFMTFFVLERFLCVWCSGSSNPIGPINPHPHLHGDLYPTSAMHSHEHGSLPGNRPMVTNLLFGAAVHSFDRWHGDCHGLHRGDASGCDHHDRHPISRGAASHWRCEHSDPQGRSQ